MKVDLCIGNHVHTPNKIRALESPLAHTKSAPKENPPILLMVIPLHSAIKIFLDLFTILMIC